MVFRPLILTLLAASMAHGADQPRHTQPLEATPSAASPGLQTQALPPISTLRGAPAPPMQVQIRRISVTGVTVLDNELVRATVAPYEQRMLTNYDLDTLRDALSQLYVDAGYISSGVLLPDQEVRDGALTFNAVEGRLTDVRIRSDRLSDSYVRRKLGVHTDQPVSIQTLTAAIESLQSDPLINRVAAQLLPSRALGQSVLDVTLTEAPARYVTLRADNHRAESVGAERATLAAGHDNLFGRGDRAQLSISSSSGSVTGSGSYELPFLNAWAAQIYASRSDADIVEAPFDDLDIESETDTVGLSVSYFFEDDRDQELSLSGGYESRSSESELLGIPFSLAPGAVDGESDVRVAYISANWLRRSSQQALALRASVRRGLDIGGATERAPGAVLDADGEFTTLLLQARYVRQIRDNWRVNVRFLAQLADDPLLSLEKLAIGGASTVRGHRENLLVRDNGWSGGAELIWQLHSQDKFPGQLALRGFADVGSSWDEQNTAVSSLVRDTTDRRTIGAIGIGVDWQPVPGLLATLEFAEDVYDNFDRDDPRDGFSERGLQDRGIHFAISYTVRF